MRTPRKPQGNGPDSEFFMAVWDALWGSGRPIETPGTSINRTTRGWYQIPKQVSVSSDGPAKSTTQDFTIISVQADYITAKNNKTNAVEKVAKNFKLRCSIVSSSVDGAAWTYTYSSTTARRAANLTYVEFQRVSPRYLVNDIIYADKPETTGVAGADWLDQNRDGRVWSAKVDQTTP